MVRLGKDAASAAIMTSKVPGCTCTGTRMSEGLADGRVKGSSTR